MKKLIIVVLLAAGLMAMSACSGYQYANVTTPIGGTPVGKTDGLTAGNWLLITTSQVPNTSGSYNTTFLRGSLAPTGSTVAGEVAPGNSFQCLTTYQSSPNGDPVSVTGQIINSNRINFTATSSTGATISITGNINNGSNLDGTYTVAGGPTMVNGVPCNGDRGTVYGTLVPPVTGAWTGAQGYNDTTLPGVTEATPSCGGQKCIGGSFAPGKVYSEYLQNADTPFATGSFVMQLDTGSPILVEVPNESNTLNRLIAIINQLNSNLNPYPNIMGIKASVVTNIVNGTGARLVLSDASGNSGMIKITHNTTGLVFPDAVYITASIQQGTTANLDGSFPLGGTMAFEGISCFTSGGTIDSTRSYIQGDEVEIVLNANGGTTVSTVLHASKITNPNIAQQIQGFQIISTACPSGNYAQGTLNQPIPFIPPTI